MGVAYGTTTLHQATKGIVQDGLVLNLDAGVRDSYNGGTTWRDLKGGNNGTLTNMDASNFSSDRGGGIVFDGTNSYVDLGSSPFIATANPFSVSFFVKMNSMPSNITSPIIIKSSNINFLILISARANYNGISIGAGSTWANGRTQTASSFFLNNWVNVCVVYDGVSSSSISSFTIYENTINRSITAGTGGLVSDAGNTEIGYINSGNTLDGIISNFLIYNKALTSDEVARNYNVMRHRFGI
jgi:hypothetical protein